MGRQRGGGLWTHLAIENEQLQVQALRLRDPADRGCRATWLSAVLLWQQTRQQPGVVGQVCLSLLRRAREGKAQGVRTEVGGVRER